MTEPVTMSVLNEHFKRLVPRNKNTVQLKNAWDLWYSNLGWYEANVGSPNTIKDAQDRIIAFNTMNGGSQFGEDNFGGETIKLGSNGDSVKVWQKILKVPQTGVFDSETHEATKNYQRAHNLDVDGIVGPATWGTVEPSRPIWQRVAPVVKSPTFAIISSGVAGGFLAVILDKNRR